MSIRGALRSVTCAGLVGALLCACSGSPGTPNGAVVNSPGGNGPPPTQLVDVHLTVTLPPTHGLKPNYISANTQSLTIGLVSVNGSPVSGVRATTLDTVAGSAGCSSGPGGLTCAATIPGSPGNDVFAVSTYAGRSGTGALLSIGTVAARVGSGGGRVPIDSKLSLTINGVIASLTLGLSPNGGKRGQATSSTVSLIAYDASGAQIIGASDYQMPISLTIEGDATGSYTLHAPGASGSSLSIAKPTAGISLHYDGNPQASSISVQAGVAGADPISANAPFTLKGNQPPPPVGTIYVLNLGSEDGLSATVTEYAGSAKGNAAPLRTLQLSSKLYARSITVDSSDNLYVGYLDSSFGFSPSNGSPDQGNVVAIFAPGASGSDPPKAVLTADKSTQTALFPLYASLNASGGLVTYGATSVDGNTGDAELTYAPGSSGPAAPLHGWDFISPNINYAGPTGLALDRGGNFYVAGAFQTTLGQQFGVYVAAAADIGNPSANPARIIPWDATTQLTPGDTTNIGLDSSGEVVVANSLLTQKGSSTSCQGRANVYAAGANGGKTDVPPLRVLTLQGIFTNNSLCASPRSSLQPFFPSITMYGNTLFAVDDFNNAVFAYPSSEGGSVNPSLNIAGSATGLNAPIAVFVSSHSGRANVRPVKSGRIEP